MVLDILKSRPQNKTNTNIHVGSPLHCKCNCLQIFEQEADYAKSMKILKDNGLRALTYQEALEHAPELIEKLKGMWFYLADQGIQKEGIYTFNNKGGLVELTGNETIDQKVRVRPDNQPLSLGVDRDDYPRCLGGRFVLIGDCSPHFTAPVVVGVRDAGAILAEGRPALGRLKRGIQR